MQRLLPGAPSWRAILAISIALIILPRRTVRLLGCPVMFAAVARPFVAIVDCVWEAQEQRTPAHYRHDQFDFPFWGAAKQKLGSECKMQVRLKILQGSKTGQEHKIPTPKCVIGRGDDCHLRPQSEAISRRHCEIVTTENEVIVRDLKSRNGTFVNDERVADEAVLLSGDILRVGPLQFELVIDQSPGKPKRPKVGDIKEAVARTAEGSSVASTADLGDVTQWLDEADTQSRRNDPEARQFRLDEAGDSSVTVAETKPSDTKTLNAGGKRPDKQAPGKLPPRPTTQKADSREAAADMLRKFFNRR
jgi:hypothetical protein